MSYWIPSKVLLPEKLISSATDDEHLMKLAIEYVKPRYSYRVIRIEKPFAICEKG